MRSQLPILLLLSMGGTTLLGQSGSTEKSCPCHMDQIKELVKKVNFPATLDKEDFEAKSHDIQLWVSNGTAVPSEDIDEDEQTSAKKTQEQIRAEDDKVVAITYPHLWERALRSTQAKFELIEQPNTILLQDATGVVKPTINPDHVLLRASAVTTYSELIPSADDVLKQAQVLKTTGIGIGTAQKALCQSSNTNGIADCLLKTGTGNRVLRLISGTKGTFTYGQNPQVQQNISVSGVAASKNLSLTGQVDFDPKNFILTGTDWNTAIASAAIYRNGADHAMFLAMQKRCPKLDVNNRVDLDSCSRRVAGPVGGRAVAAVLIPQISYVVHNQFDFIKSGGTFIEPPFPTGTLWDLTVTADLTRLIPSGKSRSDALTAVIAVRKLERDCARRAKVQTMLEQLVFNPNLVDEDVFFRNLSFILQKLSKSAL